jgi:plastocyanin
MKKTIVGFLILLVIGTLGYYVILTNNSAMYSAPTQNTATSTDTSMAGMNMSTTTTKQTTVAPKPKTVTTNASNVTVHIQNFAFSPASISVKVGTKVTWVNDDSVAHTVTADLGLFDSSVIAPKSSFSFTFANPATIAYHCNIHPSMKGTVIVTN